MTATSKILSDWNGLDIESAASEILPCCGSTRWARELAQTRPVVSDAELFERSDAVWRALSTADWDEAFRSHPRIGEKAGEKSQSATWSRGEQSGLAASSDEIGAALERGNRAYEHRFGRIYIVCATGKSAEEILADLERRLRNDAGAELLEAVEQQRQITRLRLRKWLER